MKYVLGLILLSSAIVFADTSARELYDTGIQLTQDGRLEAARLSLQTLLNSYPKDSLALEAKGAIDATLLFEEGQSRVKAGKYETARLAFETLVTVYPENPLAERAKSALDSISEKEKANRRVVKALEFRDVRAMSDEEIRAAMEEREIRLSVGKPYRSRDIEQAKIALEEILAEKGLANFRVQTQTRSVPPDAVDIIFTVEKTRASLLRSPWRLAMAGWHLVRPATDSQDLGL